LVINYLGGIVNFKVTSVNVSDNNKQLLPELLKGMEGKYYDDKGYLTNLFEELLEQGIHLVTKVKKQMDAKLTSTNGKLRLLKRGSLNPSTIC